MENTLSKKKYILETITWLIISVLWGKTLFFKCISDCTYVQTILIFCGISLCIIGGGIFLTWKQGRNYANALRSVIISWGIFGVLAYVEYYKMQIQIVLLSALIISLILTLMILGRKIKNKEKKKKIMKRRFQNIFIVWWRSMAIASLVILIPLGLSRFFQDSFMNARVDATKEYSNVEDYSKIYPEIWDDLEFQERLDVCQVIVNDQVNKLGLSHKIEIGVSNILEDGILSYYTEANHRIIIDCIYLRYANSTDITATLCHEVRHAYQIELVFILDSLDEEQQNLYIFRDIAAYKGELANYNDGSEDYEAYYTQELETDAREYGEGEAMLYLMRVSEYLRDENQIDT